MFKKTDPASGVGMKIWQCYDNLPAQAWYYTLDERIAVTGKGWARVFCGIFPTFKSPLEFQGSVLISPTAF
jgi:hypothetical protein